MFGMIILNHMNMLGNNISVKLRLFDRKIEEVDKIRFILDDDVNNAIEIDNSYSDDEFSSQFVNFEGLLINKKYKIAAEYCIKGEWVECDKCFTSTSTHNYSTGKSTYRTFKEETLPISGGIANKSDFKIGKPTILNVICEVIR